jgi:hypothetical protein
MLATGGQIRCMGVAFFTTPTTRLPMRGSGRMISSRDMVSFTMKKLRASRHGLIIEIGVMLRSIGLSTRGSSRRIIRRVGENCTLLMGRFLRGSSVRIRLMGKVRCS